MAPVVETEEPKLGGGNGGGPRNFDPNEGRGGWGDDGGQDHHYVPGAGLLAMRFMLVSIAMLFLTVGCGVLRALPLRHQLAAYSGPASALAQHRAHSGQRLGA